MGISYNKAILVGRLTADPSLTYASNGLQIAKFTLAVERQYKRDHGQASETDFIRIVAFGKTAEFASNYFSKGKLVMVEGRIQISRYQAQDGSSRTSTDIIAENIRFMETKGSGNNSEKPKDSDVMFNDDSDDDEVPF